MLIDCVECENKECFSCPVRCVSPASIYSHIDAKELIEDDSVGIEAVECKTCYFSNCVDHENCLNCMQDGELSRFISRDLNRHLDE